MTGSSMVESRHRVVSGQAFDEDARLDASVRPKNFDDFVGQTRLKENLKIAVEAARGRNDALDHVLFYGPPGLGKTTLAQILANEMGVGIRISSGPVLEHKGSLTAVLTALEQQEIFFVDEIHRLLPGLEEILYPAMEDFRVDLMVGQGPGARIHSMTLKRFTLVGATTRAGLIMAPLRSRFGIVHRLDFYKPEDLLVIVSRSAKILGIAMDESGAEEIARRSRGTPRVANRLLRRVRDFAEVRAGGKITLSAAKEALEMLGVDDHGLDEMDRNLLLAIIQKYGGGPVGLNTLAASLSEEEDAIEEIYEPYLMQLGLLDRTQRGRVATELAYKLVGAENSPTRGRDSAVSQGTIPFASAEPTSALGAAAGSEPGQLGKKVP
ncbi:MAG: Holliday junction branch migration DNA helicase RuvB [Candidatus Acidiferrales bacterium]